MEVCMSVATLVRELLKMFLISMRLQVWTSCAPDADRASKISEARPIFRACKFCLVKKINSFDLQISSQVDKRIKKLQ